MNSIGFFEIQSSDPARDISFYQAVFGWQFTRIDTIPIEYYTIATTGIRGGLLKRPVPMPPMGTGTNAYCCSVEVDDFDLYASRILQSGGIVAMAKFAVPGVCWQGYFLDPDKNVFGVFQPDAKAQN